MIERRLGNYPCFCSLLITYLTDQFEATHYKEKMLVEKVGVQTQTSAKDPNMWACKELSMGPIHISKLMVQQMKILFITGGNNYK